MYGGGGPETTSPKKYIFSASTTQRPEKLARLPASAPGGQSVPGRPPPAALYDKQVVPGRPPPAAYAEQVVLGRPPATMYAEVGLPSRPPAGSYAEQDVPGRSPPYPIGEQVVMGRPPPIPMGEQVEPGRQPPPPTSFRPPLPKIPAVQPDLSPPTHMPDPMAVVPGLGKPIPAGHPGHSLAAANGQLSRGDSSYSGESLDVDLFNTGSREKTETQTQTRRIFPTFLSESLVNLY